MSQLPVVIEVAALPAPVSAIDLYTAFLAGRSPNTREAYDRDVRLFASYLGEADAKAALARVLTLPHGEANGVLLAFKAAMIDSGLTPATINRRLAAVKAAVKLGRTLGLTHWVPEINRVKSQSFRDTLGPGLAGTRSMLTAALSQGAAAAARDGAIIRLFFDLALRRAEVVNMDVADVDISGRRVWFTGKGRTQKEYKTLPEKTLAALSGWLAVRASVVNPEQTALFVALIVTREATGSVGEGCTTLFPSSGPRSASRPGRTVFAMRASRRRSIKTTAMCERPSSTPGIPTRR